MKAKKKKLFSILSVCLFLSFFNPSTPNGNIPSSIANHNPISIHSSVSRSSYLTLNFIENTEETENFTSPRWFWRERMDKGIINIEFYQDFLFVLYEREGIHNYIDVYNISSAANISLYYRLEFVMNTSAFEIFGDNLIIGYESNETAFYTFNDADPLNFTFQGLITISHVSDHIVATDGLIACFTRTRVSVIDISDPQSPWLAKEFHIGHNSGYPNWNGHHLYIVERDIMQIWDFENPLMPSLLFKYADRYQISHIGTPMFYQNITYLPTPFFTPPPDQNRSIHPILFFDVTTPDLLTLELIEESDYIEIPLYGAPQWLSLYENYLYVQWVASSLCAFDITSPLSPQLHFTLPSEIYGNGGRLRAYKDLIFLYEPTSGFALRVLDPGWDTDGDGISDQWEICYGLDPAVNDSTADLNDDGLTVLDEFTYYISPLLNNTDEDSLLDADEVLIYFTHPAMADTDGDTLPDDDEVLIYHTNPLLFDTDGDGHNDASEILNGGDPLDPEVYPSGSYANDDIIDENDGEDDSSDVKQNISSFSYLYFTLFSIICVFLLLTKRRML
ncbi:MAG: hypothetical protein ACTSRK_12130 [Promethearchaeota archaeon]